MDPQDLASRFNNFHSFPHKQGIADIQPKIIGQQTLSVGGLTIAELSPSAYSSANVVNTLVYRDGSGNFSAGTITGKTTGNEMPLTFNAPLARSVNTISYSGDLPLSAHNIVTDTTTGSKFGTSASQKLGFFNATPIVQPSTVGTATGYTTGTGVATFHSDDTYTGNVGTTAYTLNGIVAALKNLGLIAS